MFRIAIVEDQDETRECRLEISRRQRTAFLTAVASYMGGVL